MALPILDGNQSATTLSSILTSGEHIPAHTVVSLGTQAITDISGAVSGSVVSISNFPATQPVSIASVTIGNTVTIAGTVTANPTGTQTIAGTVTAGNLPIYNETDTIIDGPVVGSIVFNVNGANAFGASGITVGSIPSLPAGTNRIGVVTIGAGTVTIGAGTAQIGSVTASISNSVTIGSLPAISGTVTANTFALQGTAVTTSDFTSTTASTLLASFNATREVLTIFNEGAGNLHICAGATCTTIAYQVRLSAGDYYEVPNHQTTITHSAVFATAGTARVTEVS